MNDFKWLKAFDYKKFMAPFVLDNDNKYYNALKNKLGEVVNELEVKGAGNDIVEIAKRYRDKIITSVGLYYQGNIIEAQTIINELVNDFSDDNIYAISGINTGIAFPGYTDDNTEVQFFRARQNNKVVDYSAEEMLHIPFDKRQIVKSERFSIPGLPCLYLGNTSYVCWIEMGRPADFQFNVSPVVLDNSQRVFNLAISMSMLYVLFEESAKQDVPIPKNDVLTILKLSMLNIATSYKITDSDRSFKSEYIISQMIMLACKSRGLDGVAYYSKQVSNEVFASVVGVNLALFASYNGEEKLSAICEHIEIGDSFNFSMFKQIFNSLKYKEYTMRIDCSPYIKNIGTFERQFPYHETEFYKFDKYLFTSWKR